MRHETFTSPAMGTEVGFCVVLPPGYDESDARYPVVYWLHGGGGHESSDLETARTWLTLYEAGEIRPVILVYPTGRRSGYMDHADGQTLVETMIIRELVPLVDRRYRTIATRERRAVHGFSMGSSGALKFAIRYPELFSSAAGYGGGSIDLERTEDPWILDILERNLDSDPDLIRANNTYHFLEKNHDAVRTGGTRFLLICGEDDDWLQSAVDFQAALQKKGIPCELRTVPGVGHDIQALTKAEGRTAALFQDRVFATIAGQ